jgi:hypothetical protein
VSRLQLGDPARREFYLPGLRRDALQQLPHLLRELQHRLLLGLQRTLFVVRLSLLRELSAEVRPLPFDRL